MTSPLCFSHFAGPISTDTDPAFLEVLTGGTDYKGVDHALSAVHEITELSLPNGQQSRSSPAHSHLEACHQLGNYE